MLPSWKYRKLAWQNVRHFTRRWCGSLTWQFGHSILNYRITASSKTLSLYLHHIWCFWLFLIHNGCSRECHPWQFGLYHLTIRLIHHLLTNLLLLKPGDHQQQFSCIKCLGSMLQILKPLWKCIHVAKSTSKGSVDMFPISLRVHEVNLGMSCSGCRRSRTSTCPCRQLERNLELGCF